MRRLPVVIAMFVVLGSLGCEEGDYLGFLERGMRQAFNGWDMWSTEAVRPYEQPQPPTPEGTVSHAQPYTLEEGNRQFEQLPDAEKKTRAALSYRRYCHHCHGKNGDGRIIVGESLEFKPTDLRSAEVQKQPDEEIYEFIVHGDKLEVPFAQTMTPLEIRLTIEHLRSLKDNPTEPYYPPQSTEPAR